MVYVQPETGVQAPPAKLGQGLHAHHVATPSLLQFPTVLMSMAQEVSRCCRDQAVSDSLANSLGVAVPQVQHLSVSIPLLSDVLLNVGNFVCAGKCNSVTVAPDHTFNTGVACSTLRSSRTSTKLDTCCTILPLYHQGVLEEVVGLYHKLAAYNHDCSVDDLLLDRYVHAGRGQPVIGTICAQWPRGDTPPSACAIANLALVAAATGPLLWSECSLHLAQVLLYTSPMVDGSNDCSTPMRRAASLQSGVGDDSDDGTEAQSLLSPTDVHQSALLQTSTMTEELPEDWFVEGQGEWEADDGQREWHDVAMDEAQQSSPQSAGSCGMEAARSSHWRTDDDDDDSFDDGPNNGGGGPRCGDHQNNCGSGEHGIPNNNGQQHAPTGSCNGQRQQAHTPPDNQPTSASDESHESHDTAFGDDVSDPVATVAALDTEQSDAALLHAMDDATLAAVMQAAYGDEENKLDKVVSTSETVQQLDGRLSVLVWLTMALAPPWLVNHLPLLMTQQWAALGWMALSAVVAAGCLQLLASPAVVRAYGLRLLYAVVLLHCGLCAVSGLGDVRSMVIRPFWLLVLLTKVRLTVSLPLALVMMMCLGSMAGTQVHMDMLQESVYLALMGGMAMRVDRAAAHAQAASHTIVA